MLEYIRYFKSSVYLINLEINPLYELITEFTTRWHSCKKNTILFNTYIKIVWDIKKNSLLNIEWSIFLIYDNLLRKMEKYFYFK